jgi:hypothetical protein
MPSPTRVLIVGVSDLLTDMLSVALTSHDDVFVTRGKGVAVSDIQPPDVVVISADEDHEDEPIRTILATWPSSLVVAFAPGGRGVLLYELRPVRTAVDDVSLGEFITTIRSARKRPPAAVIEGVPRDR